MEFLGPLPNETEACHSPGVHPNASPGFGVCLRKRDPNDTGSECQLYEGFPRNKPPSSSLVQECRYPHEFVPAFLPSDGGT